ncbi:Coronin-like protein crn1 [Tilletia horrida]|nr:Coronin-like protein crn1 [Tilletia horrida]
MSRFVRPSKYRHVFGSVAKKEACYDNVKVSNNAWDTNMIAANGKYISVNWNVSGGGAFAVLPVARTGKLPDIYPLCRGHSAAVLDTAFSPFDDSLVVSASDDGTMGVFQIADDAFDILDLSEKEKERIGGLQDFSPVRKLAGGGRKIGQVVFHPTASNVLAAASGDHVIKLWDVEAAQPRVTLSGFADTIQDISFDWTGSTLVATCRDRKLRTFDTRQGGEAVQVVDGHGGIKGSRAAWCGSLDRIITTGFSKMSDRQMFLWDSKNLSAPLKSIVLDSSSGVVMPFWSDNNIVFLAGKGDGNIRYYELESDELHFLTEYKSSEPQRGACFVPRRCLNAEENEIARAYKVTGNQVQPISFLVPRRAESFQSDIFPPAPAGEPALSAADFFNGKTSGPKLISLEDGRGVAGSGASTGSVPAAKSVPTPAPATAAPASSPSAGLPVTSPITPSTPAQQTSLPAPTRTATIPAPAPEPAAAPRAASPTKNLYGGARATPAAAAAASTPAASPAAATAPSRISRPASPVKSSSAAPAANGSAQVDELTAEVAKLKSQLVERDAYIRKLEVENEKLKVNQERVRAALMS